MIVGVAVASAGVLIAATGGVLLATSPPFLSSADIVSQPSPRVSSNGGFNWSGSQAVGGIALMAAGGACIVTGAVIGIVGISPEKPARRSSLRVIPTIGTATAGVVFSGVF